MCSSDLYPVSLKQRVAGRFGHLDNASARHLVESLDRSKLRHLIAAHLSQQNNKPQLAREALCAAVTCEPGWIGVAGQEDGFGWRDV